LGPAYTRRERTGELTAIAVAGIEALDAYFSQYLPQLALSALIPLSILIFVFPLDPLTGLILFLTAPLIPIFMILIGKAAEVLNRRQFETLSRLSAHFLDTLQGLTTLKLFGRSKSHASTIEQASEQFRETTMNVLRVTFLSALVLELVATLSTAVIAVEIGLRLLYFRMTFEQAFFLLILAPEFYIPLRMLGFRFHAGMNGTTAARKIFAILDLPTVRDPTPDLKYYKPIVTSNKKIQIEFSGLSFTYPDETVPVLRDINLRIESGQHIALVGPSGSGKSTLAHILLRFISPSGGVIWVDGQRLEKISIPDLRQKIAWVPQKPFIFNTSLADNIRLGQPGADMDAVKAAAQDADLQEFIESLPGGYETIAGEAGSRLSSGEAQRLALARAFLKDAPILILDEPTSSLDPAAEAKLEQSIRKITQERTVITIAHRLNTIFRADKIVVLKNGRIVEQGTHTELLTENGVYAQMVPEVNFKISIDQKPLIERGNVQSENTSLQPTNVQPSNLHKTNTIFRLLGFLKGSWGRVALSVLIGASTIVSSLGLIGTSAWLISAAALHPSIAELQVAIVGVRFFGISRGVLRYFERLVSHDISFRLLSRLRTWFYRAIEPLAPARLMQYRSGDLLSRVVADVDTLENFYIRVVSPTLVAVIVSFGAVVYIGQFDGRLGWVLLAFLCGLGVGVPLLIHFVSRKPGRNLVACRANLHVQLVDGIQGLADLIAFGRGADTKQQIDKLGKIYGCTQKHMAWITGFHSGLSLLLTNLGMWSVLTLGITGVNAGRIPGIMLAALTMIALVSFEGVLSLPLAAQMLGEVTESAIRLFAVVERKPEIESNGEGGLDNARGTVEGVSPSIIKFSDLSFTYPGSHAPVLRNIHFSLAEGQSLAIVGPSGSGKSTLAHLLLRFWEYPTGEISLNDRSIRAYAPAEVRSHFAVIPQQPYFFNTSIHENLSLARQGISQAEIESGARKAKIHDFITRLPKGYDTYVSESGLRLSGGERQRLAIARALLVDAPILILDEPTANLDPITEKQVLETIFSLMGGRTRVGHRRSTILITHRLVGLENVDEIIVLADGQIIERGPQSDLLRMNGFYSRLYSIQNRILVG
jgi:ATP-binding cassette subfamily C protein CydCD